MRIFFLADYCIPIHAMSLQERPLGGTETGLIRVAECLHRRGHEVKVFTSHPSPPPSPPESPQYQPLSALPLAGECDRLVVVQNCSSVFRALQAQKTYYWTGDGPEQHTTFGIGDLRFKKRISGILAVSEWHRKALAAESGLDESLIQVIRNGIHPAYFEKKAVRQKQRLIFASAPHRGLQQALQIFKLLRNHFSALELHAFSGFDLYNREQPFRGPQTAEFSRLKKECEETDGVFLHANVKQEELSAEYLKSGIYIYPATVPETSCITAIEAKAAGCPSVVSSLGALPETVADCGAVITGNPRSEEFLRKFAEAVARLLTDSKLWQQLSEKAIQQAQAHYTWEHVTERFLKAIN